MMFHRRQLLASSGFVLAATALPGQLRAALPAAPVARVQPVTETRFGITLTDPYRWMENPKDPDWQPFMKGQAARTRAALDALPGAAAMKARISALTGELPVALVPIEAGNRLFFERRPAGANSLKLFVKEGTAERLLIDPETVKDPSGAHSSLDFWEPSHDGRQIAYGLSAAGSENSVIRILDVDTGAIRPESIPNAQYGSPSWLPDGSGFFYLARRSGAILGAPDYYDFSQSRLHLVGTDPATDRAILPAPGAPKAGAIDFPVVIVTPGSSTAILLLISGVQRELTLFTAPVTDAAKGTAAWAPVAAPSDRITGFALKGDDLYLLSESGAPLGKILKTSASTPRLATATTLLAESTVALEGLFSASDALYVQVMDGGNQRFRRITPDGKASDIAMPFAAGVYAVESDPTLPGIRARISGWLHTPGIWRFDPATSTFADTGLSPQPAIDLSGYEAISGFAPARDGARIPVTVVRRKGVPQDGSAPLLLDAYGSYQISTTPVFQTRYLAFLERGGILATAGVRGGGEFGRPWWEAGRKANKPNSWRDFIDSAEYLIRERHTSSSRLAMTGTSAGGITVGRALTERPDLMALVIPRVGVLNPTRGEAEQNSAPNVPEFGDPKTPEGFKGLVAMDSYQAVKQGVRYPRVLITTGLTDPRVAPWHAAKMAAMLQKKTGSTHPVLLRVEVEGGHGLGSTRAQTDAEWADIFGAVLALAQA